MPAKPSQAYPTRRIDTWAHPTTSYWSFGALALLVWALAAAWFPIAAWSTWTLSVVALAVVASCLVWAHRSGARLLPVGLGLALPLLQIIFASPYARSMTGRHAPITVPDSPGRMMDPLLLSLGIGTTGGFLDFGLHAASVRFTALLEMLLVVSVAGSSAYTAAKAAWARVQMILIRREQ